MARSDRQTSTVGERTLSVSHLDKVLYPATGTTKGDLIHYYLAVGHVLIPQIMCRPVTRKRWVNGVGTAEDSGQGVGLAECAEVARWCREILADMGLPAYPITFGSKGIHLYAGLDGRTNSDGVSAVAHELARALEADHPDEVVSDMKRSARAGEVFVDWSPNNASKTTVSPYSPRGRARPWVAAPRTWEELEDADLRQLDLDELLERVESGRDPLAGLGAEQGPDDGAPDRLSIYRSKRDAAKTAEPVPAAAPTERAPREDQLPSFVIQEHHASSLHWDVRLEHSGVLVSWAVPKGPPLQIGPNRLAVMTEDHPLEYGTFEGAIAKGEYGAGEVSIWDTGVYEREKWREGQEVIAVLHGTPDGGLGGVPRRYALVHAPGMGSGQNAERNWLLKLMKDQPGASRPADDSPTSRGAEPADAEPADRVGLPELSVTGLPAPMLATAGTVADWDEDRDEDREWAYEMKWDGYRVLAGVRAASESAPGAVVLVSRNGQDLTEDYPALQELAHLLRGAAAEAGGAVLDGELVALNDQGRPDFGLLQIASGREDQGRSPSRRGPNIPAPVPDRIELRYMVFDLLRLGPPGDPADAPTGGPPGEKATGDPRAGRGRGARSLLHAEYAERREQLLAAVGTGALVAVPRSHHGTLAQAERVSRELGLEGVVAKRTDATYLPGTRGSAWVKLKTQRHQEVVVIGARAGQGERAGGIGSLLVAVPGGDGQLCYAGRVGTGFSRDDLQRIETTLRRIERTTPSVDDVPAADRSHVWWVTPKLVGEVSLAGRTRAGRLRQAAWRGWRPDKSVQEVQWEV